MRLTPLEGMWGLALSVVSLTQGWQFAGIYVSNFVIWHTYQRPKTMGLLSLRPGCYGVLYIMHYTHSV